MQGRQQLESVTKKFNLEDLENFFRTANERFNPTEGDYSHYADETSPDLKDLTKLGDIEFDRTQRLIVVTVKSERELTSRSGKKRQYDLAKKILRTEFFDAGIFVFYDSAGHFRFSLVVVNYSGRTRSFSNFRRYTYFVSPDLPNKTFLNQVGRADFSSIDKILRAFSIEAISNDFYNEFKPTFDRIADSVQGAGAVMNLKQDFALLFVIRIIFLGFVQKKGWMGGKIDFLQNFWQEYVTQLSSCEADKVTQLSSCKSPRDESRDTFYVRWLEPLFFEALNSPPGRKVKYQNNEFLPETEVVLQQAPYLNGELFKEKTGVDDRGLWIPDAEITAFFDFLFQYNFTIEENTLYDEELELNPEFLGIIFERMVNKADGAVYTPRIEVDFMCRMALVKWLEKNSSSDKHDLYYLFFREGGAGAEFDVVQKDGIFTPEQIKEAVQLLEKVTVCDPAAGSGAFEVGMLHVLNDVLANLLSRNHTPAELPRKTPFELKKDIIANSLYGVEVKRWAVWINQLRLWLTLFIDMPDEYRNSLEPLLPNLNFKVRCGDSLVQRIGSKMFPVQGHAQLPREIKRRITELKKVKVEFFHNRGKNAKYVRDQENRLFREILDAEIDEKRNKLTSETQFVEQIDAFGNVDTKKQKLEAAFEKEKKVLQNEIIELEEQRRNLKDEHPLIWNIEFAEIFFEGGGFDIIIGNPPYVRQEDIADPNGNLPPKDYKAALQETVRLDFPKHFKPKVKISGKSDLYTFFYLRSLHLLNSTGVHVLICSNSWLDVGYGVWVQHFLLKNVPMHFIFDNHAKRSFAGADVNTIITVFDAPNVTQLSSCEPAQDESCVTKFVAFKQPFEEVVLTENLLAIESADTVVKNDAFRVYPISAGKLLQEGFEFDNEQQEKLGMGTYIGDKWGGKYLRAPDVFFKIMTDSGGKIVRLGKHCNVITISWSRQGRNSEIILPKSGGRLEEDWVDLFKSPRDIQAIKVSKDDTKYHLQLDTTIKRQIRYAPLLWGDFKDKKHICHLCSDRVAFSHSFHGLVPYEAELLIPICAILNSSITWLMTEIYGRVGLGGGALRVLVDEMMTVYPMVNPINIDDKLIATRLVKIQERPIKDVFTECGIDPKSETPISEQEPKPLPDRAALDKVVFDALDLTEEERKEVYRAVCQLVWNRISKARSV